jgi:hypothetical protein
MRIERLISNLRWHDALMEFVVAQRLEPDGQRLRVVSEYDTHPLPMR